jgi:anti-sigma factor RsiW
MNETHPSIEQIVDYLHGELAPSEDAAIHAHLAGCRSCDERRADEVAISEALQTHARAEERELPASVVARIRTAIARPPQTAWERLRDALRPVVLVPAAAAVGVAVYLGFNAWHASVAPTAINAAYYVNNHAAMTTTAPFADEVQPAMLTSNDETR